MDFSKMMKEAQRLQKEMLEAQKQLDAMEFEGISGGGMVRVILMGNGDMRRLSIDDSLLSDKGMLEDLFIAAYHDAKKKLDQKKESDMSGLAPKDLF